MKLDALNSVLAIMGAVISFYVGNYAAATWALVAFLHSCRYIREVHK